MDLYLIRHTKVNLPEGICYGETDVDVASSFEADAKNVLCQLNGVCFNRIYISPLQRCLKLSMEVATSNTVIIQDSRLKELNFGKWEGKAWNELKDETRLFWENYEVGKRCPGGESYRDLIDRAASFLDELREESGTIGIITHGGVIRALMSLVENRPPMEMFRANVEFGQVFHYKLGNK